MQQRNIKFRAWDKQLKRWVSDVAIAATGDLYEIAQDTDLSSVGDYAGESFASPIAENRIEILQFTGLLDKNGKEIYEGDVVSEEFRDTTTINHEIRWSEGCSGFWVGTSNSLTKGFCKYLEIIGNIYENPELIKPTI